MNSTIIPNAGHAVLDAASAARDQVEALPHRVAEAVRESAQQVRAKAHSVEDHTVSYIKDEPVKSVLIAAAAGATLMGLLSLVVRGVSRG